MNAFTPTQQQHNMTWLAVSLVVLLAPFCSAGFTMDEAMAIHPDGTPVNPSSMRAAFRTGEVPPEWMEDQELMTLVAGDDLEAFTTYMQQAHSDRIFGADGSALDIKAWRQSVRDDKWYADLLQRGYPEMHDIVLSGSDEEVQAMLRAQHRAQAEAMRGESERMEL